MSAPTFLAENVGTEVGLLPQLFGAEQLTDYFFPDEDRSGDLVGVEAEFTIQDDSQLSLLLL
jgi:hypothetical protein